MHKKKKWLKSNILSTSFLGGTKTNTTGNRNKLQVCVFLSDYTAEKAFLKDTLTFRSGSIEIAYTLSVP